MKVLVAYHTTYGHTLQLARAVEAGVKSVAGVEAIGLFRMYSLYSVVVRGATRITAGPTARAMGWK